MNSKKKVRLWLLSSAMVAVISGIFYMSAEKMWATKISFNWGGVDIVFYGNPPEPSVIPLLLLTGLSTIIIVGVDKWRNKK